MAQITFATLPSSIIATQQYQGQDTILLNSIDIITPFDSNSYISFYVYDNQNSLIYSDTTDNYTISPNNTTTIVNNNPILSNINLHPETDLLDAGFEDGEYVINYQFITPRVGGQNGPLFISEISNDRTEIRLSSNALSNVEILNQTNDFIDFRNDASYFVDFYLNLGVNNLIIANNIKLDNEFTNNPTILVKLYEPLSLDYGQNDQTSIITSLIPSQAFQVLFPPEPVTIIDSTLIQGPNYNIPLKGMINNSSQNLSYSDIINGATTSSMNQVNSLLEESSIAISVDYSDFSDFIHFSSAQTRLENFNYKVGLIETYTSQSNVLSNITGSQTSIAIVQSQISDVIKNFDKFEYFMYYDSSSNASWPKQNSEPPYILYPTTSSQALTWLGSADESNSNYGGRILSASYFDNANPDQLKKAIPEYLREDPNNFQYDLFVDMVAQYYDNVWLYTKDVTQKYNADNRLDFGVSKDLVADAIKDFGLKLYQNNFSTKDLYTAFLGLTPSGSLFPFPNITGSLPTPSGFEYVDTLISASNDIIPMDDVNKSLYKRIYHNIPYLLKSKGTIAGLRALITSYGIPDTILKISEFGGKDQVDENDWDYYFNKFNYSYDTKGTTVDNSITTPWRLKSEWGTYGPKTVEFRFKAEKYPPSNLSQSIFSLYQDSIFISDLSLEYTGSGLISGSYSGSIPDPYYQHATLKWIPDVNTGHSASVYLPFFNEGWWSVMITSGSSNGFELTAANKIYNGKDGTSIGYIASSSVATGSFDLVNIAYFATSSINQAFSGSLQEIRYYNTKLSESVFKDYVMNPLSTEGNGTNSSTNQLAFRVALGSELDITTTSSIHPKITGSWATTQSFNVGNSNIILNTPPTYSKNTETIFLDQFPAGIKNRITDKIRYEDNSLPSGDTLSPFRRVTQNVEASASYTDSLNYLEVAFSPQNQINDDIISQIGYFNIGDYIGDPRQRSSSAQIYPDLNNLSEDYFKKYIKQYDLVDFIRLIKFFDNSLFKMIKDFIPVRTSLASGLVVKQHLLERNKYPQPQVSYSNESYLSGSIDMVAISGGAGGVFNKFNSLTTSPSGSLGAGPNNEYNITQSWSETFKTLSGSVSKTNDSQYEFYNGEFSGSTLIISNGELNEECDWVKNVDPQGAVFKIRSYNSTDDDFGTFINSQNFPTNGFIQTWFQDDSAVPLPPPAVTS